MKTDYIIEHIKMMHQVTSVEQKKYYQRQLDCAKPIDCVSIREVFGEKDIDLIKSIINPQPKECYKNATRLAMLFPDRVEYVEGYYGVMGVLGTEHAWNRVGDKYIDITAELVLEKNIAEEHYVQLMTMDAKEVTDMVLEEDCYTWLFGVKYANELKNKKSLGKN